ncbi:hypothetical protein C8R44DRAFT_977663 [Mycena epipterygia]|nr:hypothetical protein C8R44DRAFT_977663 [Mycena epipterygia]
MHPDPAFPPLQLKGEIMDLEFTVDTDHRKRRRNRTTQSCLNCHTSKRKCDRKRPCQRCIQLGLTGLCVYEIDDPALRDDPSLDENTRLKHRIAELESLVRELRGKPHPRWADSNFRDGDPNEKWHSRATKCAPLPKRRASPDHGHGPHPPALLPPIKTEGPPDPAPHLYRFSASPGPGGHRYFEAQRYYDAYQGPDEDHYARGGDEYARGGDDYVGAGRGAGAGYCPCRSSPAMGHAYISLSQALQSTLGAARTYAAHPPGTPCVLFRRIADLASLMQGTDPTDPAGPAYDNTGSHRPLSLSTSALSASSSSTHHNPNSAHPSSYDYDSATPPDSAVLSPGSASASSAASFHGSASTSSFHGSAGSGSPAAAFRPSPFHSNSPGSGSGSGSGSGGGGAFHAGSPGAFHPASPGAFHASSPGASAFNHPASPGGFHASSPGGGGGADPGAWGPYGPYFTGLGGGAGIGGGGTGEHMYGVGAHGIS